MKQIIFSACNDKGEPLLDFAIRQGEIWTARREPKLEDGEIVRLKRSRTGRHEAEGYVSVVCLGSFARILPWWSNVCKKSGFSMASKWLATYLELNPMRILTGDIYFIHITNIRRLK